MNEIVSLYKFKSISDHENLQKILKKRLKELKVYGTILISHEGINGTVSCASKDNLSIAIGFIESLKGLKKLDLKFSQSKNKPFIRLKVKLKKEIVTIGDTSIDPNKIVGEYIEPKDWNKLIKNKDVLLIDTRNEYECSIGTFKNSINPKTKKFSDFPKWIKDQKFSKNDKNQKKIAMFCTGGIRCEKASSLMRREGFKNVFHLKGGILRYLENIPKEESLWSGECFVFDDRVSLNHDLSKGSYDMCHGCRMPITKDEKKSDKYIKGVSCSNCFDKTTDKQKARYKTDKIRSISLRKEIKNTLVPEMKYIIR